MDADLRDLLATWLGDPIDAERRSLLMARLAADDPFRKALRHRDPDAQV